MQLNFKAIGQGPPLVILHGLFGMLDNWQTIARKLSDEFSIYLVDLRNHGRSPHLPDFNYALMAEDLNEFLESQWIYKAHIMGHSMGGKAAMQFAADYPDKVDKLIVVDMGVRAYAGGHEAIFDALLALDLQSIDSRQQADAFLADRIEDVGVRQFLMKNLSRKKEGGFRWKMNLPAIHAHYADILAALPPADPFEGETLFVRGGRSNYVHPTDLPSLRQRFPQAQLKTVEAAGHWVHAEAPKELLTILKGFLGVE
ncbi:MAG: alpha/beta fold hydrolase [Bacteroidota bacterium]